MAYKDLEKRKEYMRIYNQSIKVKEKKKVYDQSSEGKAIKKKYKQSLEGKKSDKKYRESIDPIIKKNNNKNYYKVYSQSCSGRYSIYERNAKKRNLEFALDFKSYQDDFYQKPCYYCGEICMGIDRIDNSKGYIEGNMEPCCSKCNYLKNDSNLEDLKIISEMYKKLLNRIGE